MESLSVAMQNYLETIFHLSTQPTAMEKGVRVSDIAAELGVSKASVNHAMNVLSKLGYVSNEKYQEIYLTDLGQKRASLLDDKHRIIKTLFLKVIGMAPEMADQEACAIEHIISYEAIGQIHKYLEEQQIELL